MKCLMCVQKKSKDFNDSFSWLIDCLNAVKEIIMTCLSDANKVTPSDAEFLGDAAFIQNSSSDQQLNLLNEDSDKSTDNLEDESKPGLEAIICSPVIINKSDQPSKVKIKAQETVIEESRTEMIPRNFLDCFIPKTRFWLSSYTLNDESIKEYLLQSLMCHLLVHKKEDEGITDHCDRNILGLKQPSMAITDAPYNLAIIKYNCSDSIEDHFALEDPEKDAETDTELNQITRISIDTPSVELDVCPEPDSMDGSGGMENSVELINNNPGEYERSRAECAPSILRASSLQSSEEESKTESTSDRRNESPNLENLVNLTINRSALIVKIKIKSEPINQPTADVELMSEKGTRFKRWIKYQKRMFKKGFRKLKNIFK